ncbi:MAG: chemotaxis protein CheC [Candidatus Omnitrophica bacterium]|nr:chemotaxis protein CheC [Candidatus Omnitrophota bacterium]
MDRRLSLSQLDLLKELGTIGAGRAATAMADLIGRKVEISVPQATLIPLENISGLLGGIEQRFFVLDMGMAGDVNGRIFLLFLPEEAKNLASGLLGKPAEEVDLEDEMFKSSLRETANIICGSFIGALAELTNMNIFTTVPSLALDMVGAILDFIFIQIAQYSEEALYIKTDLKVSNMKFNGLFLFFPHTESLLNIFQALGVSEDK